MGEFAKEFAREFPETQECQALDWLYTHAGPIIRWRLIRDFGYAVSTEEARAT